MNHKSFIVVTINSVLLAALALPISLAAQHARYKLIDIPTLGGLLRGVRLTAPEQPNLLTALEKGLRETAGRIRFMTKKGVCLKL